MNKIKLRFQISVIYSIVSILTHSTADAQDTVLNKYGLWVISNIKLLQITIDRDPSKDMIDLKKTIPHLYFDLRYATNDNFTKTRLYPKIHTTYLRKAAADSLLLIQKELNRNGLGLKIFDAYRPYSVTEKLWEPVKDARYAADPAKGSGHNRGVAIDLTIVILGTGKELDMGTPFDNFSDTAHHAFTHLPPMVLHNRLLLKSLMEKHGFKALDTEWWHYYLPDYHSFELLDIDFKHLKNKSHDKGNNN